MIDFKQIDEWIDKNLNKKPVHLEAEDKEWQDALLGYRNTMAQALAGNECETQECWNLIYFSAVAFCKGIERAEVKAGIRKETLYPRY